MLRLKALANEDTLLPTQMFPRLLARATFVADTNFVSGTKNVSDFVQKHFVSATNGCQFAQLKKHHGQKCVRNNVSSFTRTLRLAKGPGKGEHIVADTLLPTQMFPRLPARATFVADTNFVSGTKNVSDFVQKHFVSATNVSQFAQPKKLHGQHLPATMCPRLPEP